MKENQRRSLWRWIIVGEIWYRCEDVWVNMKFRWNNKMKDREGVNNEDKQLSENKMISKELKEKIEKWGWYARE